MIKFWIEDTDVNMSLTDGREETLQLVILIRPHAVAKMGTWMPVEQALRL